MAVEAILQRVGFCVAGADFRDSTLTGTTHAGPNGSAQFMAVQLSTVTDLTVNLTTANGARVFGILQNKPSTGIAADVAVFGVSKCVAGSTFGPGVDLMSDSSGCLIPLVASTAVLKFGRSLETVSAVGQVFSAVIFGAAVPGGL